MQVIPEIVVQDNVSESVMDLVQILNKFCIELLQADQLEADERINAFVTVGAEYDMMDAATAIKLATMDE